MEVLPNPWSGPNQTAAFQNKGALGAFILGLVFGVALGPCSFAFMAPLLGITFKMGADKFWYGMLLLTAYGIGHCLVIALAGAFAGAVQGYLNWNERSKGAIYIKYSCGIMVLAGGLYLIWKT